MLRAKGTRAIPTVPAGQRAIFYSFTVRCSEHQFKALKESNVCQKDGGSENTSGSEIAADCKDDIIEKTRDVDALRAFLRLYILPAIFAIVVCIDKWFANIRSAISIGKVNNSNSDNHECNNSNDRLVNKKQSNRSKQSSGEERMLFVSLHERRMFFCLLFHLLVSSALSVHCDFDCLNPRRPVTEDLFNKIGA